MGTVHLGVVELERDGERGLEQAAYVPAPDEERVAEDAAVHADCAVNLVSRQRRGTDNHAVRQVVVGAGLCHLFRETQVILLKGFQIIRESQICRKGTTFCGRGI